MSRFASAARIELRLLVALPVLLDSASSLAADCASDFLGGKPRLPLSPSPSRATVLNMLRRQDGASIPEIVDATGWQPPSARAFLTAAVKKWLGTSVISEKGEDGVRGY